MKNFTPILCCFLFGMLGFAQNTYVPDDNFEQFLIDEGYDSGPLDDYVPTANIETVELVRCHGRAIYDLTGIEDFTALKELYCRSNFITDFSPLAANLALEDFDCKYNYPGTIDLTANVNLIEINVEDCNLTALNIDGLLNLDTLRASRNNLSQIDISSNDVLRNLYINGNLLTELDVSSNTNLRTLVVDSNQLTSIDVTNNVLLGTFSIGDNSISELNLTQNPIISFLNCENNNLTSLNLENTQVLTVLICENNQISELVLTQNPAFRILRCANNELTQLDLSIYQMILVKCNDNALEFLDLRNGNNENVQQYNTSNNPNLSCIYVDNSAYSQSNWNLVDPNSTFVETEAECDALSIDEVVSMNIAIHPNPVSDRLSLGLYNKGSYKINNLQGQNILNGNLNAGTNNIDFTYLAAGVYIMSIETESVTMLKKIIKK